MNDKEMVNFYLSNMLTILKKKKEQFYEKKDLINLISELISIDIFKNYFKSNQNFSNSEINQLINKEADKDLLLKTIRHLIPLIDKRIKNLETLLADQENPQEDNSNAITSDDNKDLLKSYFSQVGFDFIQQYINNGDYPEPQNKHITICFLDLVGFSTMSETKEATQIVEILNEFFGQIINTVIEHNGDINKFLGDALLVAFNSAEDAVRCCIEILHNDLDVLNSKLNYLDIPEIKIHAGINTGSVVLADIGTYRRRETTFIGDGVNTASRVEGLCPPNEIWLTAMTFASLGNLKSAFSPLGKKKLKGKNNEVLLYSYKPVIDKTYRIAIIEHDTKTKEQILKELKVVDFEKIETLTKIEDVNTYPELEKVKAIAVGPSFKSKVNMSNLKDLIDKRFKKDIPLIPILGDKIDKDTYEMLNKLKIKTFANLNKKESFQRISHAVTTKDIQVIPKKEKEPEADELGVLVKKLDSEPIIQTSIPQDDNNFEEYDDRKDVEEMDEENHFEDKVDFLPHDDTINININNYINNMEFKSFSENIKHFWEKNTEEILFVNFNLNHLDHLSEDYLYKLLKPFEQTKGAQIKVNFKKEPDFWHKMKKQFEFVKAFKLL